LTAAQYARWLIMEPVANSLGVVAAKCLVMPDSFYIRMAILDQNALELRKVHSTV
jgi:hypothetical protein